MDLFTYLMAKKGYNTQRDLFSYLLGKGGGSGILPTGYRRVQYIESTGTQYIDTGRKSTINTKFDLEISVNKNAGENYQYILGSQRDGAKNRAYLLIGTPNNIQLQFPHSSSQMLYMTITGNFSTASSDPNSIIINSGEKNHYIYDIPNKKLTFNEYTCVHTETYELVPSDYNILIFNRNAATIPTTNLAIGKLYYFKWYENNELVMDLIPCVRTSDNVAGLYDIIGNQFYKSATSENFISPDYKTLEYIESTGTQYIDTGVYPYKTMEELTFAWTDMSVGNPKRFAALYDNGATPTVRYYGIEITIDNNFKVFTWDAATQFTISPADTNKHTLIFNDNDNKVYFDGTQKAQSTAFDLPRQSTLTLPIFRTTARTDSTNINSRISGRLYNLKLWDKESNAIIRDFIPCIRNKDGEIGVFDLVNNVFYGNSGEGNFIIPSLTAVNNTLHSNFQLGNNFNQDEEI